MDNAAPVDRSEPTATQTIFALASGAGRAAVAVVRVSGARSGLMLDRLCGGRPAPREAAFRAIRAADGALLDRGLVLWFPGPRSYTGEDSAELHLHGSRAVLAAVSVALIGLGLRPAEPGEFTRRAFLNGKMDLIEAEGIADLVAAETAAQHRQALRQMDGALSRTYHEWTETLRRLLAWQEAVIDFPDDELPDDIDTRLVTAIAALHAAIETHLDDGRRGERLRDGLTIVVAGPPNVGKSSLVNALVGRSVAIVSPVPGTTRDAIEARMDLRGVPVTLVDTAGLRESHDPVEVEGVRRARAHAAEADLILEVIDARVPRDGAAVAVLGPSIVAVANKIDLHDAPPDCLGVSALVGTGIDALRERLAAKASELVQGTGAPPLTRARHRSALAEAAWCLRAAQTATQADHRGEELRLALRALCRITGQVSVDDILDTVFGEFCIGK